MHMMPGTMMQMEKKMFRRSFFSSGAERERGLSWV